MERLIDGIRRIINGRRYDTNTAEELAWHQECTGSFGDYQESLFRKRTGEFFLTGHGGPRSKYKRRDGDGWAGGSGIFPLTLDEAKAWAEEFANDMYEDIFGKVGE